MFRIRDNLIAPRKALYDNALKRLPQAHLTAMEEGISHLHGRMTEAAVRAGHDPEALGIGWNGDTAHVGFTDTEAAQDLREDEYGGWDSSPSAVLRNTASRAHPEAVQVYSNALRRELGI